MIDDGVDDDDDDDDHDDDDDIAKTKASTLMKQQ